MAKDGTNRGGRRVRAGAKPGPLGEKLAAGRPATRLEDPLNEPFDFAGNDIGDGAVLAGETMPEPSDYLSEIQRDGKPLGATSSIGRRGSGSINVAVPNSWRLA